eukprot:2356286-Alexandrium_andersonii.AAC.2
MPWRDETDRCGSGTKRRPLCEAMAASLNTNASGLGNRSDPALLGNNTRKHYLSRTLASNNTC